MLGSSLLSGLGIGIISTGIYMAFTNDKRETDRKIEYSSIFCIILLVSVLVLYLTSDKKEEIVPISMKSGSLIGSNSPSVNNKPPF